MYKIYRNSIEFLFMDPIETPAPGVRPASAPFAAASAEPSTAAPGAVLRQHAWRMATRSGGCGASTENGQKYGNLWIIYR